MQQDTNSTVELTDGQQQLQPVQIETKQVVYTQSMITTQSQPQYPPPPPPPPPPQPQINIVVQNAPFSPPPQKELIVVNQVGNIALCNTSRFPILMTCPYCARLGTTRIAFQPGAGTWCCCFILCLIVWICCWIPFVSENCQDAIHLCPHCGQVVGTCLYRVCE